MALSTEVGVIEVLASPFRTSSFFNITYFYHHDLMHPLKNFYPRHSVGPRKSVSNRAPHLLTPALQVALEQHCLRLRTDTHYHLLDYSSAFQAFFSHGTIWSLPPWWIYCGTVDGPLRNTSVLRITSWKSRFNILDAVAWHYVMPMILMKECYSCIAEWHRVVKVALSAATAN